MIINRGALLQAAPIKTKIHLIPFIKAWWWHLIGWRLRYLKYWRNFK